MVIHWTIVIIEIIQLTCGVISSDPPSNSPEESNAFSSPSSETLISDNSNTPYSSRTENSRSARGGNRESHASNQFRYRKSNVELQNMMNESTTQGSINYSVRRTRPELEDISEKCLDCICQAASGWRLDNDEGQLDVDHNYRLNGPALGLFRITKAYWEDAGSLKVGNNAEASYLDCVSDEDCARRTVKSYMARYPVDCNGDGIVNCEDYAAIHYRGPFACKYPRPAPYNLRFENCWKAPISRNASKEENNGIISWFQRFLGKATTIKKQEAVNSKIEQNILPTTEPSNQAEIIATSTRENEELSSLKTNLRTKAEENPIMSTTSYQTAENTEPVTEVEDESPTNIVTTISYCTDGDNIDSTTQTYNGPTEPNQTPSSSEAHVEDTTIDGTITTNNDEKLQSITEQPIQSSTQIVNEPNPSTIESSRRDEDYEQTISENNLGVDATIQPQLDNTIVPTSESGTVDYGTAGITEPFLTQETTIPSTTVNLIEQTTVYNNIGENTPVNTEENVPTYMEDRSYEAKITTDNPMDVTESLVNIEKPIVSETDNDSPDSTNNPIQSPENIITTMKSHIIPPKIFDVSDSCIQCICEAVSSCNTDFYAVPPLYGPFHLTKKYWEDARPALSGKFANTSFIECANDMECASETVRAYLSKYKFDCNRDGLVDCDDYVAIHVNGPNGCGNMPLPADLEERYVKCYESVHQEPITTTTTMITTLKYVQQKNITVVRKFLDFLGF